MGLVFRWLSGGYLQYQSGLLGKIVVNMLVTLFLFFLCMKYLKSIYWVECCPINSKLVIWYTHVLTCLQCVLSIYYIFLQNPSFHESQNKQQIKSRAKHHCQLCLTKEVRAHLNIFGFNPVVTTGINKLLKILWLQFLWKCLAQDHLHKEYRHSCLFYSICYVQTKQNKK